MSVLDLSLAEVDVLGDALGEGLADGAWDHWSEEDRALLGVIADRARVAWNSASRADRDAVLEAEPKAKPIREVGP